MDANREMEDLMRAAADQVEKIRDMGEQLQAVRGEGEAADGLVKAIVMPGGMLEHMELAPKAMRMASADLAAAIVESVQAAAEDATAKAGELMESVVPGAGAQFAGMADPDALAADRQESQDKINAVIDTLRSGFERG